MLKATPNHCMQPTPQPVIKFACANLPPVWCAADAGRWTSSQMYSFRPATLQDLEAMMAIGHEGIGPHVERIREWITEVEERGFREHFTPNLIKIITINGVDAGYLKVENRGDHAFLDGIYISYEFRSRGIGGMVLTDLLRNTAVPVRLRVLNSNPAQHLYARLGFREVGNTQDSLIMESQSADANQI